jgi:hypothetical protein
MMNVHPIVAVALVQQKLREDRRAAERRRRNRGR